MRVVVFGSHDPDHWGAWTSRLVHERAAALEALGAAVRVVVAAPPSGPAPFWPAADVVTLHPRPLPFRNPRQSDRSGLLHRAALPRLRSLRSEFDFDLIETHGVYPAGAAAVRMARQLGVPCVLAALGPDLALVGRNSGVRKRVGASVAAAAEVLAPSATAAEALFRLGGDRHKIHVVPDAIDRARFRPGDATAARAALGLAPDAALLLAVGELVASAGHVLLVEAVAQLRQGGLRACLHLLGEGPEGARLRSRLAALDMADAVFFHAENAPERLALWYQAATLQLAASTDEVWPHALYEAQACGLPLVATATDGLDEIVCGENGMCVEPRSSEALAAGICAALARRWDREAISAGAPRRSWADVTAPRLRILRAAAPQRGHTQAMHVLQTQPA